MQVVLSSITKSYVSIFADPLGLAATSELEVGVIAEDGRKLLSAQVDQVAVVFVAIIRNAAKHGYFS